MAVTYLPSALRAGDLSRHACGAPVTYLPPRSARVTSVAPSAQLGDPNALGFNPLCYTQALHVSPVGKFRSPHV